MAAPDDDGDYLPAEIPEPPEELFADQLPMDDNTELTTLVRGHFVQLTVTREKETWKMLVDEKNLAKLIYQLQADLREISAKAT